MLLLRSCCLRLRVFLWRKLGVKLPAIRGWKARVRAVSSVPLWQDEAEGIVGLPLEWTLLTRDATRRVVPVEVECAWTGIWVSGATPILGDRGVDMSRWGVRCARCGVPLHVRHAGMVMPNDTPSCPPCRRVVNNILRGGG